MMISSLRRLFAALILSVSFLVASAQPDSNTSSSKTDPPYKVITSGKKVTIKSSQSINHVMLWTTDGDRIAEHKDVNSNSFTLNLPVSQKAYFLMVGMNNGKIYTQKVAVP